MNPSAPEPSRPARAEAFPRAVRIAARRDFTLTYGEGRKVHGRLAVVFARAAAPPGRLGITATKKVGSAVVRNRGRRRVREIYRRWRAAEGERAARVDLVVNVTARGAEAPYAALAAELETLLSRAADAAGRGGA